MKVSQSYDAPLRKGAPEQVVSPMTVILWSVVAFALGQAIVANGGLYAANGMVWLALAAFAAIMALFDRRFLRASTSAQKWMPYALAVLLLYQLRQMVFVCPAADDDSLTVWVQGIVIISMLSGLLFLKDDNRLLAVVLVAFAAIVGTALWFHTPRVIDVLEFQKVGCRLLLQGQNPYAYNMPDVYGPGFEHWYAPGMLKDGRVDTGFCYPPVCLLMALPGYLAGSIIYGQLGYLLICAILMKAASGSRGSIIVVMLACWPALGFVLTNAWTDLYVAPLMALTVYAAIKRPGSWLLPISMGLLFASKQHIFLLTPLTIMLLPGAFSWRGWFTLMAKSALVAMVVTVPFILWDPAAWWHSVIEFHLKSPFRKDALSFTGWIYHLSGTELPGILGFVAFAIYVAAALLLLPRKPPFFAAAAGGAYLFFFAWNKQAFANYYFFIAVCFLIAAAAARFEPEASTPETT